MSDPRPPALCADGPANAASTLVLAHGAGAPMDSPFMLAVATGLARVGVRVVRFEFPYMAARRSGSGRRPPDREPVLLGSFREAIAMAKGGSSRLAIGGKSMGGRMASLIADEVSAAGLICLGYPFHPTGRPEWTRTAHLESLGTPALIVQGTRDPFGRPDEVAGYRLPRSIRVRWIEDGDHSFEPRRGSGRSSAQNLDDAIDAVAGFLAAL